MATIDEQVYNQFASTLANDIRERAKGLDQGSARIVRVRPSEHNLSGFLTPRTVAPPIITDSDEEPPDDLPRDSSFNMTSLGIEFMVNNEALATVSNIDCEIDLNVYVRSLPTLAEQLRFGVWKRDSAAGQPSGKTQGIVDVWRRIATPQIRIQLPIKQLISERKLRLSLDGLLQPASEALVTDLYTARRSQNVVEAELANDAIFATAITRASQAPFSSHWRAYIDARLISVPTDPSITRVAIRVVNDSDPATGTQSEFIDPNLYAVRLLVSLPVSLHRPTIFQELQASFRYDREMPGVGINAQIEEEIVGDTTRLLAESVPITETPRLEARDFEDVDPSFQRMSHDPLPSLNALLQRMQEYLVRDWEARIQDLGGLEQQEAREARDKYEIEIQRFERGVRLLEDKNYPIVLRAFTLMNASMRRANRTHTNWRLFQLIFIVSQLPELAAREYEALASDDDGVVELLWFAAGGGKTEAFMGVMLWQCFFDRLRGKRIGNTAFVRFPLRLLTFQQLQRLFQALAAADEVRKEIGLQGARFSIGYLVGGTVTPNAIDDDLDKRFTRDGVDPKYQRIFNCPYCRTSSIELRYQSALRLVEHRCSNQSCFSYGDRLPVYVTDQDIYRYLPTLIVSTVDKLALLGQNQRFANLLGRIDLVCTAHGASFSKTNSICEAAQAFGRRRHSWCKMSCTF
jgi:hypothetical protein